MVSSIYVYFQQLNGKKEERKPTIHNGGHPMKVVIRENSLQLMAAPSQNSLENATDVFVLHVSQHSGSGPGVPFPVLISRPD